MKIPSLLADKTWSPKLIRAASTCLVVSLSVVGVHALTNPTMVEASDNGFVSVSNVSNGPTGDTEIPVITITAPPRNQKVLISDFINGAIHGSATDNVGVASVDVKLYRNRGSGNEIWDGKNFSTTPAQKTLAATMTPTSGGVDWSDDTMPSSGQLDAGVYTVYAYAHDAAGNIGYSHVSFTLGGDFTAPTVSTTAPTQGAKFALDSFGAGTINGVAGDNAGVTEVKIRLRRKRGTINEYWSGSAFTTSAKLLPTTVTTVGATSVSWSFDSGLPQSTDLDKGEYIVYAYAYDAAGNVKAASLVSFILTAPASGAPSISSAAAAPSGGSS